MSFTAPRIQEINAQYQQARRWLIWLMVVGFVVNGALFYAVLYNAPPPPLMEYTKAFASGPTALCPGDTLHYTLELEVHGAGVFEINQSIWRVTPPQTVVFSQTPRRAIYTEAVSFVSERHFILTPTYPDADTGEPMRWKPGQYEMHRSISTTSRNTEPSIVSIPFSVKSDCP